MTNLTVITPPREQPLSVASAKSFLRIGHDGDDSLVAELIDAATARIEHYAGLAFVTQTLRIDWLEWPQSITKNGVRLPRQPISSLQSVALTDDDNGRVDYQDRFRLHHGRLQLRPWSMLPAVPPSSQIQIEFVAGYEDAERVPADLREAVLRLIANLYAARPGGGQVTSRDQGLPEDVLSILATREEIRL